MTITDLIFGPESRSSDRTLDYLKQNGFTTEEAELFHFFKKRKDKGFYFGLGGGILALYFIQRGRRFMLPLFNPRLSLPFKLLILMSGYMTGNYLYNYNRTGANASLPNLYTNNVLVANKQALMIHFKPFNRSFLQEEIEQMLYNGNLKVYGPKKYIYNPYVHGSDEFKYRAKYDRFNSGEHLLTRDITAEIAKLNEEKTRHGEEVVLHPFQIKKFMSIDGTQLGLKKFGVFHKKEVI